jgi:hypothetical protein
MTQADKVLHHLKQAGTTGATAMELAQLFIPQYNWCIKWLREHGHRITSVHETDPISGKKRWRFHYEGVANESQAVL